MSEKAAVTIEVNGTPHDVKASLYDTLLTALRDQIELTGAKRGCNQGVCGACTILVDGVPVRACLSLALNSEGRRIQTIEGLSDDPLMQVLHRAFIERGAFQCAFCTPGMLISAYALIQGGGPVDDADVRSAMSGNLCRCTGYMKIIEAVQVAARDWRAGGVR
ncbi:MAG: (2Fe-2S)-binding protein [Xanthobacteraceae bacterium]|nr:MAG: (2Fe-2S)-binding protein [Xanthobacteraceae bacterium]